MPEVEIRCPVGPKRLLSKLLLSGERPTVVEGNLIEFACDDCKRTLRKGQRRVTRVLHRYNLAGELIETIVLP